MPRAWKNFKARLDSMGPERKVGLCWRSMMLGAKRAKYFSPIDAWGPILQTPGVTFIISSMATAPRNSRGRKRNSASASTRWKAWT